MSYPRLRQEIKPTKSDKAIILEYWNELVKTLKNQTEIFISLDCQLAKAVLKLQKMIQDYQAPDETELAKINAEVDETDKRWQSTFDHLDELLQVAQITIAEHDTIAEESNDSTLLDINKKHFEYLQTLIKKIMLYKNNKILLSLGDLVQEEKIDAQTTLAVKAVYGLYGYMPSLFKPAIITRALGESETAKKSKFSL